jgi:hypothetical protein
MAGKFLRRGAIIDTIKSEQRTNAIQKRKGLTQHPVRVTSCGCPDPNCGCWHTILTDQTIPTDEQCKEMLAHDKQVRKYRKPRPQYRKPRSAK